MAKDKNTIVVYRDWKDTFDALPDEKAGQLIKHFFAYVNDENPETDDILINAVFANIKQTLKRDLKKYENEKIKKSISARMGNLKRWHKDLYDRVLSEEITFEEAIGLSTSIDPDPNVSQPIANIAVSVSDSDSVSTKVDSYSEIEFLENWRTCRKHYLDKPTNFKKLLAMEKVLFTKAVSTIGREGINEAMLGLFNQEKINFDAMVLRPMHFLEKIETYLEAEKSKTYTLYGRKPVEH